MSTNLPIHNCYAQPATRHLPFLGLALVIEERCAVLGDGGCDLRFILSVEGRRGILDLTGREGAHGADLPSLTKALDTLAAAFGRPLLVTRHAGLVGHLRAEFPESASWEVVDHATPDMVRGRVVVGVLPNHLAAVALVHVEIPLDMARAQRGQELDAAAVRAIAGAPRIYAVDGI